MDREKKKKRQRRAKKEKNIPKNNPSDICEHDLTNSVNTITLLPCLVWIQMKKLCEKNKRKVEREKKKKR